MVVYQLIGQLVAWMVSWFNGRLLDWMAGWMNGLLNELDGRLVDSLCVDAGVVSAEAWLLWLGCVCACWGTG